MRPGDVVMTTSIEVRTEVKKPGMRATFKSKPGSAMVFISCGSVAQDECQYDQARRVLNAMGWTLEPEYVGQDAGIESAFGADRAEDRQ